MDFKTQIKQETEKLLKQSDLLKHEKIQETLETPPDPSFGDLATNICFSLSKKLKKPPQEIAKQITSKIKIPEGSVVKKVEAKAGYINFFLNYEKIAEDLLKTIFKEKEKYGSSDLGKGKKYMIEFAHPNPFKSFHIGHLRNISLGESICRVLSHTGFKIIRTNYQGDVGLHIAKCFWGMKQNPKEPKTIDEKVDYLTECYVIGNETYRKNSEAKKEIEEINKKIYRMDKNIKKEWEEKRQWSLEKFDQIYKRVCSHFDRLYFESEISKPGLKMCKKALERGILEESEGAIVFKGDKYELDTRVFVNKLGLPTYEGKELGLAGLEFTEFGNIDKCIHVVGPEQISFFKVTFKVEELLDPKKFKGKQYHHVYRYVRLKKGKMSSRLGNIILAEDVINETKKRLREHFKNKKEYSKEQIQNISEITAVGAVKYSMLKVSPNKEILFDINESISLEGESGPYLQYAHVRASRILEKGGKFKETFTIESMSDHEKYLIKKLLEFPEVVEKSAKEYKPHYICNYAYDLSETFSALYHSCSVIQSKGNLRNFRLTLVKAFEITLKNCLNLLGIETPKVM